MGVVPPCTKCLGFVAWDDDDTFRCVICSKRYYLRQVGARLLLAERASREPHVERPNRFRPNHVTYMRAYMRLYRARKKRPMQEEA